MSKLQNRRHRKVFKTVKQSSEVLAKNTSNQIATLASLAGHSVWPCFLQCLHHVEPISPLTGYANKNIQFETQLVRNFSFFFLIVCIVPPHGGKPYGPYKIIVTGLKHKLSISYQFQDHEPPTTYSNVSLHCAQCRREPLSFFDCMYKTKSEKVIHG